MLKTTIIVASVCISFGGFFEPAVAADPQSDSGVAADETMPEPSLSQLPHDDEQGDPSAMVPKMDPKTYSQSTDSESDRSHRTIPATPDSNLADRAVSSETMPQSKAPPNIRRAGLEVGVAARINPDDYVTVQQVTPSLLDGAEVKVASGATVGRVSKVVVGRNGSVSAVRLKLANGRNAQVGQSAPRYNARDRILLTNLKASRLEQLASAEPGD